MTSTLQNHLKNLSDIRKAKIYKHAKQLTAKFPNRPAIRLNGFEDLV